MPRITDSPPVIVWFRQDLRLVDNPALGAAAATGAPVLPLYILDDLSPGRWKLGGASRWWLHYSLESLAGSLRACGALLVLRQGEAGPMISAVIAETGARAVYWNRLYEPWAVARDARIETVLRRGGIAVHSFTASVLCEPAQVLKEDGTPYKVLAAFASACAARGEPEPPIPAPDTLRAPEQPARSDDLRDWHLLPSKPDWAGGLRATWEPGEPEALRRLHRFATDALGGYAEDRNRPDRTGSSILSPFLHWGEVGPRQVWHAMQSKERGERESAQAFLRELTWRDFARSLLYHFPDLPERPLQRSFAAMTWRQHAAERTAWQKGRTGFPIVDAGMRQLWQIGWMHNRVRMITASFLIKDLLIDWQEGQDWFWDTLVDADLANNAVNWQWVAGSGANAAPFFRIFNPALQGAKFDPQGDYVRRWVPELAKLPAKHIHEPWRAPPGVLAQAGVEIGRTYPAPIVEHATARKRALAAFAELRVEPS